ncbi:UPF0280 family protein [Chloroflexota bacterium]
MPNSGNYRNWIRDTDLVSFAVVVKQTDLYIRASSNMHRKALRLVQKYREILEKYIAQNPLFLSSLEPVAVSKDSPVIIRAMAEAAGKAGVGPMASVAGAIAECVGKELLEFSPEIILENGGDIFIKSLKDRVVGVFAGDSPFSGKIGLEIRASYTPLGICTSSGTVGHSLSFGKADAVIILSKSTPLADATATAIGNLINSASDIQLGLNFAQRIDGINGAVIIKGEDIGLWGDVRIKQINA